MRRVLVPLQASVLSAWGMLATDLTAHLSRSLPGPVDPAALEHAFAAMEAEGRARGVAALDLAVVATNEAARRLYERSGFRADLVTYRKPLG